MLLHTEYSLLSLLHSQEGVVHHHGLFKVSAEQTQTFRSEQIQTFPSEQIHTFRSEQIHTFRSEQIIRQS